MLPLKDAIIKGTSIEHLDEYFVEIYCEFSLKRVTNGGAEPN